MKTRTIIVHGQQIVLETRKCTGCSATFEVMKHSRDKFHSAACAEMKNGKRNYDFYFGVERMPDAIEKDGFIETED